MDSELNGGKPEKGPQGKVVGGAVVNGQLFCKVVEGIKAVAGIKTFLVLSVAPLYFAVVPWSIGADELMTDAQLPGNLFEKGGQVMLAAGKTVGELKTIVGLDAFDPDALPGVPLEQLLQEVGRGACRPLWIRSQETQAGKLVNGRVLV